MASFIIHSWLNSNIIFLYAISDQTSEIKTGNIIPEKGKKTGLKLKKEAIFKLKKQYMIGLYIYRFILHKQFMNTLDIYISYL